MRVLMFAAALSLFSAAWTPAEACACEAIPPPRPYMTPSEMDVWHRGEMRRQIVAEFDRAFAVFSGEVISDAYLVRVRFHRDRVWKGTLPEFFWMKTGFRVAPDGSITWPSSCDFSLPRGQRFLIFAYGTSIENMGTAACTFSTSLEDAGSTIAVLDALVKERARKPERPAIKR